jgi:uncharacterized protein
MKDPFFGRQRELQILQRLLTKRTASLVVIKGRRRIGKSRLAEEFGKSLKTYTFVGLPPEKQTTAQHQREEFSRQMQEQIGIPGLSADDWGNLFWHLANHTQEGRILVIFDEINWMGDKDPTFLGKLKTAWDIHFKKNSELILLLSGSMTSWIDKNILSSTGFVGRISVDMTLDELPLAICNQFWHPREEMVSSYEKFKILSVTGGVPRYLEEIRPEWTAEENIRVLCFEKEAFLFKEFDRIFSDLFQKKNDAYLKIVQRLSQGNAVLDDIAEALEMKKGGTVSEYLEDLILTGYVSRDYTWNLKTGTPSLLSHYRLKDNYLRFYLKVIEPNRHIILQDEIVKPAAWDSIMGLQFENLVLNNRKRLKECLNIFSENVIFDNPYFQKNTETHRGCQIDYMIQTFYNSLYLFEIKFSKDKIGMEVIAEIQDKIQRLSAPRNLSIWPVLIHVNGVTEPVRKSGFFSKIIDFGDFLV